MRIIITFSFVLISIQAAFTQADTIFYTSFDSIDYLQEEPQSGYEGKILLYGEDSLIYPGTVYDNNLWYWFNADGDQLGISDHYEEQEDVAIYLDSTWTKWHMYPYDDLISTGETNGRHTFDTIKNWGVRAISWFASPSQAYNLLLSKPIFLSDPSISSLSWRSKPLQGPRFQDGYKVYVIPGWWYTAESIDWTQFEPVFTMKEMNSVPSPSQQDSSLFKIEQNQGFLPSDGVMHDNYSLPEPTGSGLVDSSRQIPFMQEFDVSLENVSGGYIQILFLHDAHDDNAILIDDILLMGADAGPIAVEETQAIEINVYPNPASESVMIAVGERLIGGNLLLSDLQGRVLKRTKIRDRQVRLELEGIASGMYQIIYDVEEERQVLPLLIK